MVDNSPNRLSSELLETFHNGLIKINPFNFKDYGVVEVYLKPADLYKLNFHKRDKVDLLSHFLENTGGSTDNRDFGILLEDWDRSPDKYNNFHQHQMESWTIDVNIKARNWLTSTVTVFMYATYSMDLLIDGDLVIKTVF